MEPSPEVFVAIGVGVLSLCFIIALYGRTKAAVRTAPSILCFCGYRGWTRSTRRSIVKRT